MKEIGLYILIGDKFIKIISYYLLFAKAISTLSIIYNK